MNAEISVVWDKIQSMINEFIVLLPNIVLALIVFAIFFFVAGAIKRLLGISGVDLSCVLDDYESLIVDEPEESLLLEANRKFSIKV